MRKDEAESASAQALTPISDDAIEPSEADDTTAVSDDRSRRYQGPFVSVEELETSSSTEEELGPDEIPDFPVADESKFKLPELNSSIKRKRKPRESETASTPENDSESKNKLTTENISRLTAAYRSGGNDAKQLIMEIEKDPDYLFQTGNAKGEYDLASAIIGTGQPNKEGVYLLPYLQSGHILLLGIILLVAFIYYPGFPLTEAEDSVRDGLKAGLATVFLVNACLSVLAFRSAKERKQPAVFWGMKTLLLGNLAFNELRRNAPLTQERNGRR